MKQLNNTQKQKIKAFGLTVEDIARVEESTGWRYAQHTSGGDIRFYVQEVRGKYEFVIWLHSNSESLVSVGIWAKHDKGKVQSLFHKKLGTWSPIGMISDGYTDQGCNPEHGHVGDWRTRIMAKDFMKNFNTIRKMVEEIKTKLKETGLLVVLNNL